MDIEIKDLTPDQRIIMLRLCDAMENGHACRLVTRPAGPKTRGIRETATGCALVRKGLAKRLPTGRFEATAEGYWLGDGLRIARRLANAR